MREALPALQPCFSPTLTLPGGDAAGTALEIKDTLLVGERLSSAHALSKPLARVLYVTDVTAIAEGHCSISVDSGIRHAVALGGPSSPPGGGPS